MTLSRIRFVSVLLWAFALAAAAQSPSTTTVQGTVYNATGAPTSGTLQLSWPAFSTAANQAIAAGRLAVNIGVDGFFSVNLAPNLGANPAGLYYTAVYHLADGTTSTEYWTVPAAAQTTLAQVRAQLMPASQAVQAVNKAYVDQAIQQAASNQISSVGGTLSGPLYLSGDPVSPTQATDKRYVDSLFGQALPIAGGTATGPVTATQLGGVYQADQSPGVDFASKLQACINRLNTTYGGTCDARNFSGSLTMSAPVTIAAANVTVQLPCATIATAFPIVIAAGTRNVTLHGCATRGTSSASGSQGGTVFLFSGSAALFQVGDSTYSADTLGFHLDDVSINTTAATSASAEALAAWRTQEMHLDSLYLLGNSNQTALTLDGTGNYTGGTFSDVEIGGYLTAVNAIGHQVSNSATTDWLNASTFLRLHIDCPTSNGAPLAGSIGINLQQGDGNTFTGGDVESCGTALHLGPNAQNNTIVGLRNENSSTQVLADPGSAYNNWITGGTMFTGKLTDNGTRNSFLDTFHRSFNALNGDWYGSQQDATLTNHFRLGIGNGTERGLLNRYQTDYGYRWTTGFSDASAGEQYYQLLDELNNVYRISVGQYNYGQSSTNNQTVLNSAGTGAVVLNGSNNAGTGGVVIGSGGVTSSTVATIDKSGNAHFTGTLLADGTSQSTGTLTVRNNADSEVDYYLWPGLTANQKGSFTYKDYNGNSQWYLVKDASNNWAVNSAVGGLDSFKAYQSSNSGDTYINASNSAGVVRVNYETGSGAAFNIYGGNSSTLYAGFTAANAIKFPGLAASSGHNCMQIDNSGYLTNTGTPCGSGSGGTINTGILGQIAYYTATGAAISGVTAVPLGSGGTGAMDAPTALANLGAVPASGGAMTGPLSGTSANFSSTVTAAQVQSPIAPSGYGVADWSDATGQCKPFRGTINLKDCGITGSGDETAKLKAAMQAAMTSHADLFGPAGLTVNICGLALDYTTQEFHLHGGVQTNNGIQAAPAQFSLKATSGCANPLLDASAIQYIRQVEIDRVQFDLNNTAPNGIKTNFSIGWNVHNNNLTNPPAGGILIYDALGEYDSFQQNIFNGNKAWAFFTTDCNHCKIIDNKVYTTGGMGRTGGVDLIAENNDIEASFDYPYSSLDSPWEFADTGLMSGHVTGSYMELSGNSWCGILSASGNGTTTTVTGNCQSGHPMAAATGQWISLAGTHSALDANNKVLASNTGTATNPVLTWPASGSASVSSLSVSSITNSSGEATATFSTSISAVPFDVVTFSGTGSCYDGNSYILDTVSGSTSTFSTAASWQPSCTAAVSAAGTGTFGQIQGPYISNPTMLYFSATGTAAYNYFQSGSRALNFGSYGLRAAGNGSYTGNTFANLDGDLYLYGGLPSISAGSYLFAGNDSQSNLHTVPVLATSASIAGTVNAATAAYFANGHRHMFSGGAISQQGTTSTNMGSTFDLTLANIQSLVNTSATTVNSLYGAKANGNIMPGLYLVESQNSNTTLATSAFNNANGADLALKPFHPLPYILGPNGNMREVGYGSVLMSAPASGTKYLRDDLTWATPSGGGGGGGVVLQCKLTSPVTLTGGSTGAQNNITVCDLPALTATQVVTFTYYIATSGTPTGSDAVGIRLCPSATPTSGCQLFTNSSISTGGSGYVIQRGEFVNQNSTSAQQFDGLGYGAGSATPWMGTSALSTAAGSNSAGGSASLILTTVPGNSANTDVVKTFTVWIQ